MRLGDGVNQPLFFMAKAVSQKHFDPGTADFLSPTDNQYRDYVMFRKLHRSGVGEVAWYSFRQSQSLFSEVKEPIRTEILFWM